MKPSPLYKRLKDHGVVFEEVIGHERPRWFARGNVAQHNHYSFRRNAVHDMITIKCSAVRNSDRVSALSLSGPRARDVVGKCTNADLTNAGFRWRTAKEITVAGHPVRALRMSDAGELGWELHMQRENALALYNASGRLVKPLISWTMVAIR